MNRRAVLTGAVAASVPIALASGVAPLAGQPGGAGAEPGETEILRLYRTYLTLIDAAEAHPSMDDALIDQLFLQEADEIEDRIMQLPCTCAADLAAKMLVAHHFGDWVLSGDAPVWVEARNLVGGLVRAAPWG